MEAWGSPSHRVLHIQQADHAFLILLIHCLILWVKFRRHRGFKWTDVEHSSGWLGYETAHSTLHDASANWEGYAEKQCWWDSGNDEELC